MRRILISFASAVLLAVSFPLLAKADLLVTDWSLATRIYEPGDSQYVSSVVFSVQNPLQTTRTATLGNSFSTANYDIGWILDEAHFDITTSHHLAQLDGETITEGRVFFTPSVDSIVTFTGNWQYSWPNAAIGITTLSLAVFDVATSEPIAVVARHGGNVTIGPPFGQFDLNGSASLLAGGEYMLSYLGRVSHSDPTPPGTFGEASGDFHFTITPIPEPAAGLLALAALSRRPRRVPTA